METAEEVTVSTATKGKQVPEVPEPGQLKWNELTFADETEEFSIESASFIDYTIIMSAVSIGHIGQLAVDVLLTNLPVWSTPVKIGRIDHPALEPVVGADCLQPLKEGETPGLMTNCEMYLATESRYVILQFHAPVTMRGRQDFCDALTRWIKKKEFERVVIFTGICGEDRIDCQLQGSQVRYIANEYNPMPMVDKLFEQGWRSIELREFPAPAVYIGMKEGLSEDEKTLHVPMSGITKFMTISSLKYETPLLALMIFANEGDNTPEALTLFEMADKAFDFRNLDSCAINSGRSNPSNDYVEREEFIVPKEDLIIPLSWAHLKEEEYPAGIY